ncbi:hypothetical protein CCR75_003482 [Bremia lactucae]|uniref:Uncharacterized protein n=1 Tax=Bremia lactucae TaxID=4779 RepID=A0A976FRF9_BRELC|nr:hypothetical protein CCR75_003482 [Bremia lactucae]
MQNSYQQLAMNETLRVHDAKPVEDLTPPRVPCRFVALTKERHLVTDLLGNGWMGSSAAEIATMVNQQPRRTNMIASAALKLSWA